MKKLSVLIILTLLFANICPAEAGIISLHKSRAEQNRLYKSAYNDVKRVIDQQTVYTNKYDLDGLSSLYAKEFVNSDGFDKEVYFKLIKETWETYPDISYKTQINKIEVGENYATVYVDEVAVATSKETVEELTVIGELYSTSKCVYYLEKQGSKWLISSEKVLDETSTLKYGDARYADIDLNVPKQIGAGKEYTASLNVVTPVNSVIIASISKENIVYPQTKSEDAFRKLTDNSVLERVFTSNKNNVNEYAVASVGITRAESVSDTQARIYMGGLAFIMTRINVIPENKFIQTESEK